MIQHHIAKRIAVFSAVLLTTQSGSAATLSIVQDIHVPSNKMASNAISLVHTNTANVTSFGHIDDHFRILTSPSDVRVDENDCLMTVMLAMASLALVDNMQKVQPESYEDARFPSVIIQTGSPPAGGGIEARFVIWGLFYATRPMIAYHNWTVVDFTLLMKDEVVGFISFQTTGASPIPIQGLETENITRRSPSPSSNPLAIYDTAAPASSTGLVPKLDVVLTTVGNPVPKEDILDAYLRQLLHFVVLPSGDVVYVTNGEFAGEIYVEIKPILRAQGPILSNSIAAWSVPSIPYIFLTEREQRWTEATFVLKWENSFLGRSSIVRRSIRGQ